VPLAQRLFTGIREFVSTPISPLHLQPVPLKELGQQLHPDHPGEMAVAGSGVSDCRALGIGPHRLYGRHGSR